MSYKDKTDQELIEECRKLRRQLVEIEINLKELYLILNKLKYHKMETKQKTPWKKLFDYRFLSAEELSGETTVTIKEITTDEAFNGKSKETVHVLKFEGAKKGMILNKTNAKTLASIAKSPYIEDWIGLKIVLTSANVQAFGQTVPALRIKQDLSKIKV